MAHKTAPLAAVVAFAALLAGCSDAPVVPVQPTNRRVIAEVISESG